jgi:hypothetical protein
LRRVSSVASGLCATAVAAALTATTGALAPAATAAPIRPVATAKRLADATPAHFRVASFNVLGASHTPAGGKRAVGTTRIVWANRLLNRHHVDVAGLQEFQAVQYDKFMSITNGAWDAYPGLQLKRIDSENSIIWRTAKFDLVSATTVNIPYFDGSPRAMPVVLLRDKASGMLTYFSNFHNPADTAQHHHQGKWRSIATDIEGKLQNQLMRTGIPRIMTGDMNDRAAYFCAITAKSWVAAARPGTYRHHGRTGVCHADKPRAVDWILGSQRLDYSGYVEDRSHLVDITTDHPVIVSSVDVTPEMLPNGWLADAPARLVPRVSWHRP